LILSNAAKLLKYLWWNLVFVFACFVPKQKNLWVFGAWLGERYADNPRYLFEYIISQEPRIQPIWLTKNKTEADRIRARGYQVILMNSLAAYWVCMRARVAVVNQSVFSDLLAPAISPTTLKIQLYHGIPLKKVGYDDAIHLPPEKKRLQRLKEILFPFFRENYALVTATSAETKRTFTSAFDVNPDTVSITGFPRYDILLSPPGNQAISSSACIRIMYLPTFRGRVGSQIDVLKMAGFDAEAVNSKLEHYNAVLLIKLHPVNVPTEELLYELERFSRFQFVRETDLYEEMKSIDILITDYSSVFFDFLLVDKPIIFLPYDYEHYLENDRQLYYSYEQVTPGPKARNWAEAMTFVDEAVVAPEKYRDERQTVRDRFHRFQDTNSCKRIVEQIITLR
jgi:CDP-glycerol glycerophosphotransferase